MNRLLNYLEPFHHLQTVSDLGFWQRHQRDLMLRAMAGQFVRYAFRWAVIAAALFMLDAFVVPGVIAILIAVLSSFALSFVLIIGTTAAAFVIGSKLRTG